MIHFSSCKEVFVLVLHRHILPTNLSAIISYICIMFCLLIFAHLTDTFELHFQEAAIFFYTMAWVLCCTFNDITCIMLVHAYGWVEWRREWNDAEIRLFEQLSTSSQILNFKILIYIWWRTVFDLISEHALISGHPPFFLLNFFLILLLFLIVNFLILILIIISSDFREGNTSLLYLSYYILVLYLSTRALTLRVRLLGQIKKKWTKKFGGAKKKLLSGLSAN